MTFLIIILALWLLVTAAGLLPLILLSLDPFNQVDQPGLILARASAALGGTWLYEQGFEPESAVRPMGMPIALFRHEHRHTAVALYFVKDNLITDFVTAFPNDISLTTSNTKDGFTVPTAPGAMSQAFPIMSSNALWQSHLDAVVLLSQELGVDPIELAPVAQEMKHHVKRQTAYIFIHPWLILTLPWRFAITRHRMAGMSIAQQIERRSISLEAFRHRVRQT